MVRSFLNRTQTGWFDVEPTTPSAPIKGTGAFSGWRGHPSLTKEGNIANLDSTALARERNFAVRVIVNSSSSGALTLFLNIVQPAYGSFGTYIRRLPVQQ